MIGKKSRRPSTWNYPLHEDFEHMMQRVAEKWFDENRLPKHDHYPYILQSHDLWEKNLILPAVAEYIKEEQKSREANGLGFPLNKFLHHGLSSQAMLFNLIGPFLAAESKDWAPLKNAFDAAKATWPSGEVEVRLEVADHKVLGEHPLHPTSLDLGIQGDKASSALFIECKLVEKEFGGCSVFSRGDCNGQNPARDFDLCYLHHCKRRYWTRLEELGFMQGRFVDSAVCLLSQHYQFFREVLFALSQGGNFVLLVDKRNPTFFRDGQGGQRGLMPFLTSFVPKFYQPRIKTVFVQQVVQAIKESGRHENWIHEFERKYGHPPD